VRVEESGCNTHVSAHAAAHRHFVTQFCVTEKIVTLAASRWREDM
jgi:hypothetical protein